MKDDLSIYSLGTLKNLNEENMNKIICFLKLNGCDFIEDIIRDYLDIFTIDYELFVSKYNDLNEKYDFKYMEKMRLNIDLLEMMFY